MSDNHSSYLHNRSLHEPLVARGIRPLRIAPYRPQTDGKVERNQQTLEHEWALGQVYRPSEHRARALADWVEHYNHSTPHSEIRDRQPISRVHDLSRQDTCGGRTRVAPMIAGPDRQAAP